MRLAMLMLVGASALLASNAAGQDQILHRVSLPIDGRWVDVRSFVPPGDESVRIVLSGTLSSAVDGSEIDALSRWEGETRIDAEGPFVIVPDGSELLRADAESHRYEIAIPRSGDTRVALDVTPLATRHLITPSELRAGLSGAIEMEVLAPPPGAVTAAVESARTEASILPVAAWVAAGAGVPVLALFGFLFARRRRNGPADERLVRRARLGVRAVEREASRLGPAFDEVVVASRRMHDGALDVQKHYREARDAERRTRTMRSEGAQQKRRELRSQQAEALTRLKHIAERIEETVTELAAHGAGQARARHVDELVRELDLEIGTAVTADAEANEAA